MFHISVGEAVEGGIKYEAVDTIKTKIVFVPVRKCGWEDFSIQTTDFIIFEIVFGKSKYII